MNAPKRAGGWGGHIDIPKMAGDAPKKGREPMSAPKKAEGVHTYILT